MVGREKELAFALNKNENTSKRKGILLRQTHKYENNIKF